MAELQKTFADCDKENQETFTDADFTNSVLPENVKPLRSNDTFKSRQTDGSVQLAEKLAAFKKQKRESLMPSTRTRKNLQTLDANTHPCKDFSASCKLANSVASSATPLSLKTAHATTSPFNASAFLVPSVEPKVRTSEGSKKFLLPVDSNELKLAKERMLQREQNQNDREAKLNKKAQELKAKESKIETEQALLEKQKKTQLDLLRQEREAFMQEKAVYQVQLDRCDHIDEEMTKREAAMKMRQEMACAEAIELAKKKEAELFLVFKEREMNLNLENEMKKIEIENYFLACKQEIERQEAKLRLDQEAFEKETAAFQNCLEQQQQQAQRLQLREAALIDDQAINEACRNENEKLQQSLIQKERELFTNVEKLEHVKRDQLAKEAELRQKQIDFEAQESKAIETILASKRAEKRLTVAEDTLAQKQKAFNLAQEQHLAEVLDWQSAKESLIFENEQLKSKQLSVVEAEARLDLSKRNLQSEKQKLALEWQQYQTHKAEQLDKELQLHATQQRIEAALCELKNKETTISMQQESLLLEQAAFTKRSEDLRVRQLDFDQKSHDIKDKEAAIENSLVSTLEMKEKNLCEQAKINALLVQISQKEIAFVEERAKVQQFQKLLLAEEENVLDREQRIKEREGELEDLICAMEARDADLTLRETAVAVRDQEINMRFSKMRQFEAVFDT